MILKKYQSYLLKLFLKSFILITIVFFCIVIIINIFEEVRFAEKYSTETYYTIYLSLLNTPSIIFELFPFIFLISVKYFYLTLSEKNELGILNSNGISKLKIIILISLLTISLGLFILLFYYSLSSDLKSKYLDIKNRFSNSNEYLAVVNDNGLWIKEEIDENLFIIHAEKFYKNNLELITITTADKYYNNKSTISAQTAKISLQTMILLN